MYRRRTVGFLEVSLCVFALAASATQGCKTRTSTKGEVKQEADDREGERTKALVTSHLKFQDFVNSIVQDGIKETKANPEELPAYVFDRIGQKQPRTGYRVNEILPKMFRDHLAEKKIALGNFIPLSAAEVWLEDNLVWEVASSEKQSEHARFRDVTLKTASGTLPPEILRFTWKESRFGSKNEDKWQDRLLYWTRNPTVMTQSGADHAMSPTVRMSGKKKGGGTEDVLIGIDKFAHFFNMGYLLYAHPETRSNKELRWKVSQFLEGDPALLGITKSEYKKLQDVAQELGRIGKTSGYALFGFLGGLSTGVVSQADMEANEYGFQFYQCLAEDPARAKLDFVNGTCFDTEFSIGLFNEEKTPNQLIRGNSFSYFFKFLGSLK
jgi:hypothetical protein